VDDPEVRCEYSVKYPSVLEYPVSTQLCLTTKTILWCAPVCRALPDTSHKCCNTEEFRVRGGVRGTVGVRLSTCVVRVLYVRCCTRAVPLHAVVPYTALYCDVGPRPEQRGAQYRASTREYP
jgi:hypothetical protein